MLIEAGDDIAFHARATRRCSFSSASPSRDADVLTPDKINGDPNLAMSSYVDHFGNRVTRVGFLRGSWHSPIAS